MEKKINIAELLKDCPKGMELDCLMYEDVYFDCVDELNIIHCYIQHETHKTSLTFNQHGTPNSDIKSKCVIFPKGKTTWEGFQRPFKDGKILSNGICICLYNGNESEKYYGCYVGVGHIDFPNYFINHPQNSYFTKENSRLATEEEKQKLFDTIKANGYKWNADTKTLKKLVEPKFKVGDRIKSIISSSYYTVVDIKSDQYFIKSDTEKYPYQVPFSNEINYELATNKFDITTLNPFDKVLVRCSTLEKWRIQLFEKYDKTYQHSFICIGCNKYTQCIPYEGNEHLLGKTDDCNEFYKTWE